MIVDEHNAMAYEYLIFDGYALANEGVRGDLAAVTNYDSLLYLDEGTDFGIVPDLTSVQVHKSGMKNLYILSKINIICDRHKISRSMVALIVEATERRK